MSLHDKSLIVDLTLAGITTSRTDRNLTDAVLRSQSAEKEAGRWVSKLWPPEALEPIRALDSQIRAYHHSKTLPWLDKGGRICATRAFTGYTDTMRGHRVTRDKLVREHFLGRYTYWMDAARQMRGHLFQIGEYPIREEAAERFRFEMHATPIPHRDDFRVSLAAADLDTMRDDLDARLKEAELVAQRALLDRIAEPLEKLVNRLADTEARFQDSLVTNLRELADAIPDLNILDDPAIDQLRDRIAALASTSPDSLRDSRSDRARTVSKASSILATMAPWMDPSILSDAA